MMKMFSIVALISVTALGACGGGSKDPKDACEAIYQKGGQTPPKAYTGDHTKFMEACVKAGDETRRCMQLSGSEAFKDENCGPGHGNTFQESFDLMKLGGGN